MAGALLTSHGALSIMGDSRISVFLWLEKLHPESVLKILGAAQ